MDIFERKYAALVPPHESSEWCPLIADNVACVHAKEDQDSYCCWPWWLVCHRASQIASKLGSSWVGSPTWLNSWSTSAPGPTISNLWQAGIPKHDGPGLEADVIRPISIYSLPYGLCAKARYTSLRDDFLHAAHLEAWLDERMLPAATHVMRLTSELDTVDKPTSTPHYRSSTI
eukprot:5295622-Amphidinium_carterae.5